MEESPPPPPAMATVSPGHCEDTSSLLPINEMASQHRRYHSGDGHHHATSHLQPLLRRSSLFVIAVALSFVDLLILSRHATDTKGSFLRHEWELFAPEAVVILQRQRQLTDVNAETAIVRPFAPHDGESLYASFQDWNEYPPCDTAAGGTVTPKTDLVLSFSQTLKDHPAAELIVNRIKTEFDGKQGWTRCFDRLVIYEAHITSSQDIYERGEIRSEKWVMGPNLQFQRTFYAMAAAHYKTMVIIEKDAKPRADDWINLLMKDIELNRPFAVLGRYAVERRAIS